jgi:PilZ domain
MVQLKPKLKRDARRSRQQSAWIMFDRDHVSRECQVMDVSLNGAKIVADIDAEVGSRFRFSLVPDAPKRQPCEVIWRRGKTLGIKFVN